MSTPCHGPDESGVIIRGKRRCPRCGHRMTVAGVAPQETRSLMLASPQAALGIAVRELGDRRRARYVSKWTGRKAA